MQKTRPLLRRRTLLLTLGIAAVAIVWWDVIAAIGMQLLAASLLALLALPICRVLERRIPPGAAAALSLAMLCVGAVLLLMLLAPPLIRQLTQLTQAIPQLVEGLQALWGRLSAWMGDRGLDTAPLRDGLFRQLTDGAGGVLTSLVSWATRFAAGVGKVLLAPLLAFYLLRDRRTFALSLLLLLPPALRLHVMRTLRTVRREMSAYFRGQWLLSLAVGGMTALALLLTGTPAWLLLGILMGVMELIPYIGPFLAGAPAVLLALQNGWVRALWTLGAIVAVQQVEAAFLSPRLLGNAAKMHPMAVLLLVSAGGMVAGPLGMLLVIPGAILIRGLTRSIPTEAKTGRS